MMNCYLNHKGIRHSNQKHFQSMKKSLKIQFKRPRRKIKDLINHQEILRILIKNKVGEIKLKIGQFLEFDLEYTLTVQQDL